MQFNHVIVDKIISANIMNQFYQAVDNYIEGPEVAKLASVYQVAMKEAGLPAAKIAEVVQNRDEVIKNNMKMALVEETFGSAVDKAISSHRTQTETPKEAARVIMDAVWTRQADSSVKITFTFYSQEEADMFNAIA